MNALHFNKTRLSEVMSFEAYKILNELLQSESKLPNGAKIPTTKYFTGRGANLLTSVVIKYLKLSCWHAERVNTTGQMHKIIGEYKYTFSASRKGSADIHAVINGRSVKIEIKCGRDKQSEAQKRYQRDIERAGGVYLIVRQFDEVLNYL